MTDPFEFKKLYFKISASYLKFKIFLAWQSVYQCLIGFRTNECSFKVLLQNSLLLSEELRKNSLMGRCVQPI